MTTGLTPPGGAPTAPVIDASAFLAYLLGEPGGERVARAIAGGGVITTVNLAEVLSTLASRGQAPVRVVALLESRRIRGGAVHVEPVSQADAVEIARLRPLTRAAGLSLGDRACLAVAQRLGVPAPTAARAWLDIQTDVDVVLVRGDRE